MADVDKTYEYVKTVWKNEQTQLNETNMRHIEDGIENATNGLNEVTTTCNNYTDAKIKEAITDTLSKNY